MSTKHKPSKNLCSILSRLYNKAARQEGIPETIRLTNNLRVDIRVMGGIVALLISRSSVYPSPTEWTTVCRHWPYPIEAQPEKLIRSKPTRHYLRAYFPIQIELDLQADRPHGEPVNV